jgi:hypothetical protein
VCTFHLNGAPWGGPLHFGDAVDAQQLELAAAAAPHAPPPRAAGAAFMPAVLLASEEGVVVNFGSTHFDFEPPAGHYPVDPTNLDIGALVPLNHIRAFREVARTLLLSRPLPPFFQNEGNPFENAGAARQGAPHVALVVGAGDGMAVSQYEMANNGRAFGTVWTDCTVTSDRWYFEVALQTQGLMQVGWCVPARCEPKASAGEGIGDDEFSVGLDLFRRCYWFNGTATPVTVGRRWTVGDIIGCGVDLGAKRIVFSLNGNIVCEVAIGRDVALDFSAGLSPAVSLRSGNTVAVNVGSAPLRYKLDGFRALSVADTWLERVDAYYSMIGAADVDADVPDAELDAAARSRNCEAARLVRFVDAIALAEGKSLPQVQLARSDANAEVWDAAWLPSPAGPMAPLEALEEQFRTLKLFDRLVHTVVPLVDIGDAPGSLTAMLFQARGLMFAATRNALATRLVTETNAKGEDLRLTVNRATAARHTAEQDPSGLKTLFGQTFSLLHAQHPRLFRTSHRFWNVVFAGEGAEDVGGPYREHLSSMCTELMSPALQLFVATPNNAHNVGEHRDALVPSPSATAPLHLAMFRFVGQLMGGAMRCGEPLSLYFPPGVWRALASLPCGEADLRHTDQMCVQCCDEFRALAASGPGAADTFNEAFATETFTTQLSDGSTKELVPGGAETRVTFERCDEYVSAVVAARLGEASAQLDAMREGLCTVVPRAALVLLDPAEFELRVCGRPDYTVAELRETTTLEGLTHEDARVRFLWAVLEDASPAQRRMFLKFVSGRERLPVRLRVLPLPAPGDANQMLPRAATCFFALELPKYTTLEALRDKLIFAITNCVDIDTDFRAREFDENDGPQLSLGIEDTRRDDGDDTTHVSDAE